MRALALSRLGAMLSVMVTSWPASANTWAIPWPIRPAPTTAMRAFDMSASRVAAVGIEDVAGVEVRRLRREEVKRPRKIGRFAEPAFRHPRQEAGTYGLAALVVGEHPFRQRRAEDRRPQRIDRDASIAP